jgi:aminopeptidase N
MHTRSILLSLLLLFIPATLVFPQQNASTRERFREKEMQRYTLLSKRAQYTARASDSYDVLHYRIAIALPTADPDFGGTVTMTLKSLVASLDTVVLNAVDAMTISKVSNGASDLTFTHASDLLTILLPSGLPKDQTASLTITYSTPFANSPIDRRSVQNVELGVPTMSISSQSEPYDARGWWPCKDDPADKADSVDIVVTTDSSLDVVSNGLELSNVPTGSQHTVHWSTHYPTATYLVMVALAKYAHTETPFTHGGKTIPVGNWWYSMTAANMDPNRTDMLDGLKTYSDLFITYPYMNEKYGMAEYRAFGGSMEHQTCTSMGFYGTGVVEHELSHQWFGDKVTCATFEHIWLNEGWATYCEALYDESKGGLAALRANMAGNAFYGPGTIFVTDPENNQNIIFNNNLTYNKASWVVHMVRHVVGDQAFFPAVRKYLGSDARDTYRSVTTKEFQGYLERESGKDLEPFFQNWIYGQYYPTYKLTWDAAQNGSEYNVTVNIEQMYVPQRQIFDMPIDLTFRFDTGDTTIVIHNNTETASYSFTFPRKPKSVLLDKDDWILKKVVQPIVHPTFDKGILLVNGLDWDVSSYTADAKSAYADSVFTADKPFTFWDIFANPSAGYPANMPAPFGTGAVPSDELGNYCTVVWVGNAYNGDDAIWANTSIMEYIKAGGNVVLLSRMGQSFISGDLQQFLGITWAQGAGQTARSCNAAQPYLVDMALTGEQNLVNFFSPTFTRADNTLLFTDDAGSATQGLGVWAHPMVIDGQMSGHMMFVGLRPYRINHLALRANMQALLDSLPCIPKAVAVETVPPQSMHVQLEQNYPNPVSLSRSDHTTVDFELPGATSEMVTLRVYDALGRCVQDVLHESLAPGRHFISLRLDRLTPGLYSYALQSGRNSQSRSMIIVR